MLRLPLIAMKRRDAEPVPEASLTPDGERMRFAFQCEMVQTAQRMVGSGLGAAVLPRLAVDEHDPRVSVVDVGDRLPPLSFGMVWHSRRALRPSVLHVRDAAKAARTLLGDRQGL